MFPENLVQACFQQVILTFAHIAPLFPLSITFFFPAITQQMELAHQKWQEMYLGMEEFQVPPLYCVPGLSVTVK